MRKITFGMHFCWCMLLFSLIALPSMAVDKASELFGTWKFTSKMEITEFGEKYAEHVKQECDVILTKDESGYFDMQIEGLAGGGTMVVDLKDNKIVAKNPNGQMGAWPNGGLSIANTAGEYPWGGAFSNFTMPVDASGKVIEIPDFTAVYCNHGEQSAEIVAKFTNCKLTLEAKEEIIAEDLSGNYHFKALSAPEESSMTDEFDMVLTAENETFTSYAVTMTYLDKEGNDFGKLEFAGCKFDGVELVIPYENAYLNEDVFLFNALQGIPLSEVWKGEIVFNKTSGSSLALSGYGITYGTLDPNGTVNSDKGKISVVQYYYNGTAVKSVKAADFAGVYNLHAATSLTMKDCFPFKDDFTMIVTDLGEYGWYLTELMGQDLKSLNYGGIPCEVNGNVLTIKISSSPSYFQFAMDEEYNILDQDHVYDGNGLNVDNLTLTLNEEDNTVTMSDFSIYHKVGEDEGMAAWFGDITGKKQGGSSIAAVSAQKESSVYVSNGVIYVKGGEAALQIFTTNGSKVFDGVASQVSGLAKGLYIVKCGTSVTKVLL